MLYTQVVSLSPPLSGEHMAFDVSAVYLQDPLDTQSAISRTSKVCYE